MTIFCLSVPHRGEPGAYACADRADFISRMRQSADRSGRDIYSRRTIGELRAELGDDEALPNEIAHLADDAPVWRADWLLGEGVYAAEDPGEYEAVRAYAGRDVSGFYAAETEAEADAILAELTGPFAPWIGQCGPLRAAAALAAIL